MRREISSVGSDSPETAAWPTVATWRYLGERSAADGAYSARFGTTDVPTPNLAPGGLWAYPLPDTESVR
jgi:hypothetical protein